MPLRAIARLIQTMLYAQRFFPYYVYNILGGIEEDGRSRSSQCGDSPGYTSLPERSMNVWKHPLPALVVAYRLSNMGTGSEMCDCLFRRERVSPHS